LVDPGAWGKPWDKLPLEGQSAYVGAPRVRRMIRSNPKTNAQDWYRVYLCLVQQRCGNGSKKTGEVVGNRVGPFGKGDQGIRTASRTLPSAFLAWIGTPDGRLGGQVKKHV